jgi:uncharacterized protein YecT (DUF1311 family)
VLLCTAAQSFAASFNCAKAKTKAEKLICADATLSRSDEVLAESFRETLAKDPNPDLVRRWQRHWLSMTRDACADAACMRSAYNAHMSEIVERWAAGAKTSYSGTYLRYRGTQPDRHRAELTVVALSNGRVRLFGDAIWIGNATNGAVNVGEVDALVSLDGERIEVGGPSGNDCRFTVTVKVGLLSVSGDNGQCGGLNVSFDGDYRIDAAASH